MKKILIYIIIIIFIGFCNNTDKNFKLAKDYFSSKQFDLAKKELLNITENDYNYKNAELLLKQLFY